MDEVDKKLYKLTEDYNQWAERKDIAKKQYKNFCKKCDRKMDQIKKEISNLSKK